MIKMILCADLNGGIGKENGLLYNVKGDLKSFKELTLGHRIVMGYNTWESLPKKPLPGRVNTVLTSREIDNDEVHIVRSIEDIIEMGKRDDIFVIGGARLYNEFLEYSEYIDEIYLTLVAHTHPDADAHVNINELTGIFNKRELLKIFEVEGICNHAYLFKCTK